MVIEWGICAFWPYCEEEDTGMLIFEEVEEWLKTMMLAKECLSFPNRIEGNLPIFRHLKN